MNKIHQPRKKIMAEKNTIIYDSDDRDYDISELKEKKLPLWKRIKENILSIFDVYKQIKEDKKESVEFKTKLMELSTLPKSQFSMYELHASEDLQYISTLVTLPEEYRNMPEHFVLSKLNDICGFLTNYLRQPDVFGLYISSPEYLHVEDPNLPEYIDSLTYAVYWTFIPQVSDDKKRKYIHGRNWSIATAIAVAAAIPLMIIFL